MDNFLGGSAEWYKRTIILFLVLNPVLMLLLGPFATGWILLGEFIFCLAMALKCYPLQPCGQLAMEAIVIGLTAPASVFHETERNFEVILLLIFMVAGIYFLKELLRFIFENAAVRAVLLCRSRALRLPRCADGHGRDHRGRHDLLCDLPQGLVGQGFR
jgi:NhaB family Na+:H+ antiporter